MRKQVRKKYSKKKPQRKIKRNSIQPILIVAAIIILSAGAVALNEFILRDDFAEVDVIEVSGDNLLLGAGCLGIVGAISMERGEAIQLGLDNELNNRPSVYDIFRDVIEQYDIQLESVEITRIENNNFLSTATFSAGNKILKADARPSDAIALALRTKTPIFINRTLLEELGTNICPEPNQ